MIYSRISNIEDYVYICIDFVMGCAMFCSAIVPIEWLHLSVVKMRPLTDAV